jgi:hypothetical protein
MHLDNEDLAQQVALTA